MACENYETKVGLFALGQGVGCVSYGVQITMPGSHPELVSHAS